MCYQAVISTSTSSWPNGQGRRSPKPKIAGSSPVEDVNQIFFATHDCHAEATVGTQMFFFLLLQIMFIAVGREAADTAIFLCRNALPQQSASRVKEGEKGECTLAEREKVGEIFE